MKRVLSLVLSLILVLSLSAFVIPAWADDPVVWDGTTAAAFAGGDGSQANPYSISTPAQWDYFAKQICNGTTDFLGKSIKLENDIVFNTGDASTWNDAAPAHEVMPAGYDDGPSAMFAGTFDGNGHTISGVYMDQPEEGWGYALFGTTAAATIRNLRLSNSAFKITTKGWAGALIGEVYNGTTTIQNVYLDSTVYVFSTQNSVGGFVGGMESDGAVSIVDSVFAGTVSASGMMQIGGFVGNGNGKPVTLTNCLMIGTVIGSTDQTCGFVGINQNADITLTRCVYAGSGYGRYPFFDAYKKETSDSFSITGCYTTTDADTKAYRKNSSSTAIIPDGTDVISVTPKDLCGTDASVTIPGWTKRAGDIMIPSGIASFASLPQMIVLQYTVTWLNEDGTVLATETYTYGEMPEYKGEDPTKEEDRDYIYNFDRWSPAIGAVVGDTAYTAVFSRSGKSIPADSVTDEIPVTTATEAPATTTAAPEKTAKKGCKSVIGSGIAMIVMIAGAGVVLCRKKEQ